MLECVEGTSRMILENVSMKFNEIGSEVVFHGYGKIFSRDFNLGKADVRYNYDTFLSVFD